jgi:hypothetical protein
MRFAGLVVFALAVFAQTSGSITGTVSDTDGIVLPKVAIQARNGATGVIYKASSSATGVYTLGQLPAGSYELSATVPGMIPYQKQGIVVPAAQTLHLNIRVEDYETLNTLGDGRAEFARWTLEHKTPSGPAPRTAGKPDFSGVWHGPRIVDPGKPEMTAWASALFKERTENFHKDYPFSRCLPVAPLDNNSFVLKFVQTPKLLVIMHPANLPRQIFLDGRNHPKDLYPTWAGHSVGRWEGDTLVVDTVGFNDQQWIDYDGHPQTEKMHLIERFRRPDLGHLEIQMTFHDPAAYATPWSVKAISDLAPGEELDEYICTENNKDPQHLVGK